LFAYGLALHDELDVPVGLIVGAVGATPSICWLSREAYEDSEACRAVVADYTAAVWPGELQKQQTRWQETVAAAREAGRPSPGAFRPWRKSIPGSFSGNWKTGVPHAHYENRIRPVIPFAVRGVLWDQGENGTAITGLDQYTLMGALIRGWREDWGQGDFPFIYVQKPSGPGCAWDRADPVTRCAREFSPLPETVPDTEDGLHVENHIRIRRYPNTAMVNSSDLGPNNHPDNKSGYGARAARVALGLTYGRKVEICGPVYASHQIEADKVRIRFTHVGQGLVCRHAGKLQGFSVAGEDRVFKWADAVIDGDSVIVSSSSVKAPVAVRYGWGRTYPWANLFNRDRLPALPFRTDTWEQPRAGGVGSTRR
jgi:sialate O-acetylesterase